MAGWALGQVAALLYLSGAGGQAPLTEVLTWSINAGALCACMVGCLASGFGQVPAGGCTAYVVGWVLLLATAYQVCTRLGLPDIQVVVLALTGLLVGFSVPGEGPLTVLMLLFVLVFASAYGLTASQGHGPVILAFLLPFVLAELALARWLKRK